jgi:uncharacterized membrane protein YfcA
MSEWLPALLALAGTGALAGVMAGLLGVGGGIVIVPVLYHLLQLAGVGPGSAALMATGTSLATIVPTSLSSLRAHHRRGNVDWALLRRWTPWMVAGVLIGGLVATRAGGGTVALVFGFVALAVAANLLFRADAAPLAPDLPAAPVQGLLAGAVGFVSVLMGIGGGTLGVPILTAFGRAAHRAVGTAAAFGLVIAVPGALTMLLGGRAPADALPGTVGYVNLPGFALIVPLTVLCAPLGVRVGAALEGRRLKQVFAVFLILSGLRMISQHLPF